LAARRDHFLRIHAEKQYRGLTTGARIPRTIVVTEVVESRPQRKETPMKQTLAVMLAVSAIATAAGAAAQTDYPEKPIRIVIGFSPGGLTDTVARLLGQKFAEAWGKPVMVENVPGAAGNIAADRVAKAAPDGYTLGLTNDAQIVINPSLYKLPYDPVKDFAPISQVFITSNILVVHNAVPAKNVRELVALAKARPGELTFASGGSGNQSRLSGEWLKSMAGIDISHIPYKGGTQAIPDLLAGRVTMMFSPIQTVLPLVREGKLRALAVTSLRRSSVVPELPTMDESGYPGFEATPWQGLLAPAGTPATIVRKLHLETVRVLALADVRAKLADLGMEVIGNSPDEFAVLIKSEIPKWAKLIKESGIKPD
jgi:tripartite-type tricarboxylate transporter receptor subunit TctC